MNKLELLKQYALTKYRQNFSNLDTLQSYQNRKIKNHLRFVLKNSPFYHEFYEDYQIELKENRWRELPMIDKSLMMSRFDDFNTVGIK